MQHEVSGSDAKIKWEISSSYWGCRLRFESVDTGFGNRKQRLL